MECTHPERAREDYHDGSVMCRTCNCVIEQYGKLLNKPSPLGMIFPFHAASTPSATMSFTEAEIRGVAVEFFCWWYNQPGSNTAQGFDDWWEKYGKSKYGR